MSSDLCTFSVKAYAMKYLYIAIEIKYLKYLMGKIEKITDNL